MIILSFYVFYNDVETLKVFLHANDESYEISINGIPEFSAQYTKNIIQSSKPKNFIILQNITYSKKMLLFCQA